MSMTGTDIVNAARPLVNDEDKSTWPDDSANWLLFLNEGVRRIYHDHPECRLLTDGTMRVYAAMTAVASTVPLDDVYKTAMAEYLAYRFFDCDAGDNRDASRAGEHLQAFESCFSAKP